MQDPVAPNCDGVLLPDESLTNSSAGQHIDHLRSRAAGSSGAPRHLTFCIRLRAAGLGGEHRRKEAQDQQHRQPDEDSGPEDGDDDPLNRCVHATETPFQTVLFRRPY